MRYPSLWASWPLLLGTLVSMPTFTSPCHAEWTTVLVTAKPDGTAPPWGGDYPVLSADGRYVAFYSIADELPPGPGNGVTQFYRRDMETGTMIRVSVSNSGAMQNSNPDTWYRPTMSANGSRIAFSTMATNLVTDHANWIDVFMRDVNAGLTSWVSVNSSGVQGNRSSDFPGMSPDGRYVAFCSTSFNLAPGAQDDIMNVFLRDTLAGTTVRVSRADGQDGAKPNEGCYFPAVSAGGEVVAFTSYARNLVSNDTNSCDDVFVRYIATGKTECVSVTPTGKPANSTSSMARITPNGRYVAFQSAAYDILPGGIGQFQAYVRDLLTKTTSRVSIGYDGNPAQYGASEVCISDDGRYVSFRSQGKNLVPDDTNDASDMFVRDTVAGTTRRVSFAADGSQIGGYGVWNTVMSGDGQRYAFTSESANIVPGVTGGRQVYLRMETSVPPFSTSDAGLAVKAAMGLSVPSYADAARLNVVDPATSGVDLRDAVRIARKAAGLDPNP